MVGMYLIDTAGRKKLMAVGSGLMVLFALGISFSYANNYQLLMLIFVMCFTSCFAFSMGPIPWIMIPELFPTYLRGRAPVSAPCSCGAPTGPSASSPRC